MPAIQGRHSRRVGSHQPPMSDHGLRSMRLGISMIPGAGFGPASVSIRVVISSVALSYQVRISRAVLTRGLSLSFRALFLSLFHTQAFR